MVLKSISIGKLSGSAASAAGVAGAAATIWRSRFQVAAGSAVCRAYREFFRICSVKGRVLSRRALYAFRRVQADTVLRQA